MDSSKKANITIGIGVTTTPNRKEYLNLWMDYFRKNMTANYHLHIHTDDNYRGVAYSKNQNIKALSGCDYIFLFDDDCYITKPNWHEYFINSGESHLLYLNPSHGVLAQVGEIEYYQNCGGVFMMITKEIVEAVGYMNSDYGRYGFEHAGYSNRIFKAGFTKSPYQQLKNTKDYLYSIDYEGSLNGIKHISSLDEETKKKEIEKNRQIFINELNSNNIFCKFAD